MKQHSYKGPIILLITAFLWGTTFVAQAIGGLHIDAFTYNTFRYLTAALVLLSVTLIRKMINKDRSLQLIHNETPKMNCKVIIFIAILVGVALFLGGTFQQIGITITKSSSKSGFISSLYIVFVPIIGMLYGKKCKLSIFLWTGIAVGGSFLMALDSSFNIEVGDLLTLICAFFFALQIVFIDVVNPHIDSIFLTGIEFLVAGILSLICALLFETTTIDSIISAIPAILYAAILSSCVAYTLQAIGQKHTSYAVAPLIMSLESVFALISGLIILHEDIPLQGYIGCALIFIAIICAQIDFKALFKTKQKTSS